MTDDLTSGEPHILDSRDSGALVVGGGTTRVIAYCGGALLSVASTAVVARQLGAAGFDGFATVLSLSLVALLVTDFGMAILGVREYVALAGAERDHSMRVLLALRLLLMTLGAAAMVAFALLAGFSMPLVWGALLAGVGLVIQTIPATYVVPLHATLRLSMVSAVDFVRQAVQAALLVVLALVGAGVIPLLAASIPAALVSAALAVSAARGLAPMKPSFDFPAMRRMLRTALSFAVATTVGTTYAYVAQIVTHLSTSEDDSGLFALAFRVFSVVIAIAMIATGSAYPVLTRAAGRDPRRFGYAGSRMYEGVLLLGIVVALGIGAGAPAIVQILGGPPFADAVVMLQILAIAVAGSFLVAVGSFLLLSLRKHRALLVINTAALVLSVALTWTLARSWGGNGAAISLCITEYVLAAAFWVVVRRSDHPVRPAGRRLLSAGLALLPALGMAVLLNRLGGGLFTSAVSGVLCPAVFVVVVLLTGGVPPSS
ncbi:polysaccharide biosynthesis C-terminal domain-containing protein [Rhodococcus sp. X156]|uniref:polysaccharide biosynthesis C-terminal domain-containing protein n=1 Tax=Rhodococcus sp. X156 TaxID=2499145 RepID=UPI000FD79193|nr:polysaccharide biosynthesis C-terminal domain-containing protein [Rhodococcus sp. X156]